MRLVCIPRFYSGPNPVLDVGDQQGTRHTLTLEERMLKGEILPRPLLVYFICFSAVVAQRFHRQNKGSVYWDLEGS